MSMMTNRRETSTVYFDAMGRRHIQTRIEDLSRRTNTVNGNPRWIVETSEGFGMMTGDDYGVNYRICNPWIGRRADLVLDEQGLVIDVTLLD